MEASAAGVGAGCRLPRIVRGRAATASAPTTASETSKVRPVVIAQRRDAHRHERLGDPVGGQHDAHHAPQAGQAVELGGHQRDDHVVAAEADAEGDRRELQRAQ
jgi:hypothetical protein